MDALNPLILRIRPTYLDDIALFDPLHADGQPRFTGDHHDWEKTTTARSILILLFRAVTPRVMSGCVFAALPRCSFMSRR
jgi:hypothetical protein